MTQEDLLKAANGNRYSLIWAVGIQDIATVRKLIESGSLIDSTVMSIAARSSSVEILDLLLKSGGSISACNSINEPLIMISAMNLRFDLMAFLLKQGASPNTIMADCSTVGHFLASIGQFQQVYLLLEHGFNPLLRRRTGASAARYIFHYKINPRIFPEELGWQEKCQKFILDKNIQPPGPKDENNPLPIPK